MSTGTREQWEARAATWAAGHDWPLLTVTTLAREECSGCADAVQSINREATRLADELAPSQCWPTDEPRPDLSGLWRTKRGRGGPRPSRRLRRYAAWGERHWT